MREFLYKNSFLRYYFSLFKRNTAYRRSGFVLIFLVAYFGIPLLTVWLGAYAFTGILLFIICAVQGQLRRSVPNLSSLMPLTSRRKIVYQYLSPLMTELLIALGFLLTELAIFILVNFYLLLNKLGVGGEFFTVQFDILVGIFRHMGGYGTAYFFAFMPLCYAAGMIFGFLPKTGHRVLVAVIFYAVIYFSTYLVTYDYAHTGASMFFVSPFGSEVFEAMAHPLLCVIFAWAAAIAAFAGSVWYVNKAIGKKDF